MANTVMLFGLGLVGEYALQILAATEAVDRIVASSRNEELGIFKVDAAARGSSYLGFTKQIEFRKNDVNDIDTTG
jgi:saccharopine dehydrogenase-like NADP-dependent oxidoreductase